MSSFFISARIPGARGRAGVIRTPHGDIETPAFIPVGTKATVKAVLPESVRDQAGASAVLANTYHLYLQPGSELLERAGGLGSFMNWRGPTLTDSGGFQAFSLQGGLKDRRSKFDNEEGKKEKKEREDAPEIDLVKMDDDGVTFKSVIDGSTHRFTPEASIRIQHSIGADVIFALDECAAIGAPREAQEKAVARTTKWAERCLDEHVRLGNSNATGLSQSLFGIVQGGKFEDLRRRSAREIAAMSFDGFGIGGTFEKADMATAVSWVCEELPEDKPRHLLGIGEPEDIILGIESGADTFDCVAPTRLGRNGGAYTSQGRINLLNAKFVDRFGPIDDGCGCYTCENYATAYVAHLFRSKEMLAATLTSIHNLYFLVNLAKEAREAIISGKFGEFKERWLTQMV